jgi:hypothetical protein
MSLLLPVCGNLSGRSDILMNRRTIIILLALPALCMAVSLDSYFSATYEGDSLGFSSGRHRIDLDAVLSGTSWSLALDESFTSSDSSDIIERYLTCTLESDLDFRYRVGAILINPDFRYCMDPGDGAELTFPASAGIGVRKGYMRPGIVLGADLPGDIRISGKALYWNRDVETEDGIGISWTEIRYGGGLLWESPWGIDLSASGVSHNTSVEEIDYDVDWTRLDFALSTEPRSLPTLTQVMADIRYSVFDGDDYLGNPLASRLTGRIRAVQEFNPSLALNMTLTSALDLDDVTRIASTQGAARLIYHFMKSGRVPSSISIGGQITRSVVETRRLDLASRINIYSGLSLLLDVDLWEGPTSVAGADPTRKKVVLGAGLEYRILDNLLVWATIAQERSDFAEVEIWERLDAGLEFYPGRFIF